MEIPSSLRKPTQVKTMAELLPSLGGILSQDCIQSLTDKKEPRTTLRTRTDQKLPRPMTIAQMKAEITALKVQSPRRLVQQTASSKKRAWNSSVKVDKKISHTSNGQMKNNPVRKVLNFQPKPKPFLNSRCTVMSVETPKFPKPEFRAKKALHVQEKNVRISGVFNMPETPALSQNKTRVPIANKENMSILSNSRKSVLPKPLSMKKRISTLPETPMSNVSWKSSCDNSFLLKEKEINDEERINAAAIERTQNNVMEVSQTASTPFKEYRDVQDYFNNSSCVTSPMAAEDNTIMCFDKTTVCDKREESVIESLCELLSKTTVTNNKEGTSELDKLIQIEKQTEEHIKNIETVIEVLKTMKETEKKSLESVKKMISEKRSNTAGNDANKTLVSHNNTEPTVSSSLPSTSKNVNCKLDGIPSPTHPGVPKPHSLIKSIYKSPSYKIPKKNSPLRKKIFHKSMPIALNGLHTPPNDSKALTMYMKMKEQMKFLNTPVVKQRPFVAPDTPALTSQNLQKQLHKLFGES